ncbi:MAG: tetratricopeptide repeat protein [Chloroflexi bacterium]|nr:tetratricopeptide repeat protein [Chloroflexota bacterium]
MGRRRKGKGSAAVWAVLLAIVACIGGLGLRHGGAQGLVERLQTAVWERRPPAPAVDAPSAAVLPWDGAAPVLIAEPTLPAASAALPTSSPTPSTTPAPAPSFTPTFTATPRPTPTPAYLPAASSVALAGLTHAWQTWNNCGPATLALALSYFGSELGQGEIGAALRPYEDDKNVSPEELAAYARGQGFRAVVRVNGSADRLRLLLSNGLPVLVETWREPAPDDGMGHYRLLTGYDHALEEWIVYDSYDSMGLDPSAPYAGIRLPYAGFDALWWVFNRVYVLVFTDAEAPLVEAIVGGEMDDAAMLARALDDTRRATEEHPEDPFAWFNLGSNLVEVGQFHQAAAAYDRAREIGLPWRMLWYQFGPFRAYYEVGRFDDLLALAAATLQTVDSIEEIHYWRGMALQAKGDAAAARQAFHRVLELQPHHEDARRQLETMTGS